MKLIIGFFRICGGLILIGSLVFIFGFSLLMTACTNGGALIVIIPIAIFAIPPYFRLINDVFTGKKAEEGKISEGPNNSSVDKSP